MTRDEDFVASADFPQVPVSLIATVPNVHEFSQGAWGRNGTRAPVVMGEICQQLNGCEAANALLEAVSDSNLWWSNGSNPREAATNY